MPLSVTFAFGNRSLSSMASPHSPPSARAPNQPAIAPPLRNSRFDWMANGRANESAAPIG